MDGKKGIEVEYNFTVGYSFESMEKLLQSFTRTSNFKDAKDYTTDLINSLIDSYTDYYYSNRDLAKKLFNSEYMSSRITFLGEDDICIQFTLLYEDPDTKEVYSKVCGSVMSLEEITEPYLAAENKNEREFIYGAVTSEFSDLVIDCFIQLVEYVAERVY